MRYRLRLMNIGLVLLVVGMWLSSANVCRAGWCHWGHFNRAVRYARCHIRPQVFYSYARHACRTYPRYVYHHVRRPCHRPVYRYPRPCGVTSSYVNFGLGCASRFIGDCRPAGYIGYSYPRYYGYSSWGTYSPYGVHYVPRTNHVEYYLPPVHYPAELNYGPQAVKQFMGVDRNFALGPLKTASYAPARDATRLVDLDAEPRASNTRTLDLARRYIDFGDARFAAQEFHLAAQRYKTAAATAPDLADAHIRYGLALTALAKYSSATQAIERGLALDPDWPRRGLQLDDLYGDSRAAKVGHLDTLARKVLADTNNADAVYLLGVYMYLDGHQARAQKMLLRAAELKRDDRVLRPFAAPVEPAAKVASVRL
jgi:hypothetical protein